MTVVELMVRTLDNEEFAFAAKKEALGPHIKSRWGWDETYQRKVHAQRWAAKAWFRILHEGKVVGTVAIDHEPDHVRLGEFYIWPKDQRRGIGAVVLASVIRDANTRRLPTRLECLKWNPALSFYARNGFVVTGESDIHYFMERAARSGDS